MNVFVISWMNIWVWESYPKDAIENGIALLFWSRFGHVRAQTMIFLRALSNFWWNMESMLQSRNEKPVITVDFSWQKCSEEGINGFTGQEGDAIIYWDSHGIVFTDYLKGKLSQNSVLLDLLNLFIGSISEWIGEK